MTDTTSRFASLENAVQIDRTAMPLPARTFRPGRADRPIVSFADFLVRAAKLPAADRTHVRELWRRGWCAEASAYVEERGTVPTTLQAILIELHGMAMRGVPSQTMLPKINAALAGLDDAP